MTVEIPPGQEWAGEIDTHLKTAHIIILLISADFLNSDYCYITEMQQALQRHETEEATVIPIILREVDWRGSPFGKLQALPKNAQPVTSWPNRDEALADVARGIRKAIEERHSKLFSVPTSFPAMASVGPSGGPTLPLLWNVPHERNPFFTGREHVLQALRQALTRDSAAALTQIQAISGLGGIGKTQTAVEYAYHYCNDYNAVFWVRAETEAELSTGFVQIAQLLGLPELEAQNLDKTVEAVKNWLENHHGWLLIFDNADHPELLRRFRPRNPRGHILLTSRAQVFDMLAISRPIEMQAMLPQEAFSFLFNRTGRDERDAAEKERDAAAQLASELGYLPLALEQSSAYITTKHARFQDYLTSYRKQRLQVLNKSHPKLGDYPASVATTWDLNVREVEQTPAALDLLHLSAFLSPEQIPLELITNGASHLGPASADLLAEAKDDPLVLDEMLEPLTRYSLIRRDVDAHTYSIHRLVQEVVKDELDAATRLLWAERAVRMVNASFPFDEVAPWPQSQRYLPHALLCATAIAHGNMQFFEAANLLHNVGIYFYNRGQYQEAEPLIQRALEIRERVLGPEHPDTAQSLNSLALLYWHQGKDEQAEPLIQRALAIYERVLGPEHPDTASSLNNLAILYREQGKDEQAEPLYQRALAIYERVLGPEHPNTATSLNNLAALYDSQGKDEQAEPLYQRALAIMERVLGPEHPDTAQSLNNLAILYRDQGKYEQAEPLYQRALAIRERVLGPEHPDTANSLNNLANLYRHQGKDEQAEPLFQRALAIYEHVLGPEHPSTRATRKNYAELLQKMERGTETAELRDEG